MSKMGESMFVAIRPDIRIPIKKVNYKCVMKVTYQWVMPKKRAKYERNESRP